MKNIFLLVCFFCITLVNAQINLPVDFEMMGTTYFTDYDGNLSVTGVDPTDPNNTVAITTKTAIAGPWAGTMIGTNGFASPIPFSASQTTISLRVYSAYPGTPIHMKAEDAIDPSISVETRMYTTKNNEWETIVFDFTNNVHGTPTLNLNTSYEKLLVFFNLGTDGPTAGSRDFYWDDVMMGGTSTTLGQLDLPVTFELVGTSYALIDFENNSSTIGVDPVNPNNTVAITTKPVNTPAWSGTIVGTRNGFVNTIPFSPTEATISMRVYSPDANTPILLKAEVATDPTKTVETIQYTTKSNEWEVIEWNFLQHVPTGQPIDFSLDYGLLAVFFNFGTDGATAGSKTYYWDDVTFGTFTNTSKVEALDVSYFPNPVTNQLTINTEETIDEVSIFNSLGQLVYTEQASNNQTVFDVSELAAGFYFVKVSAGEAIGSFKIVKE